jgi:eukaryotic-like serine/threonine-protein kinase
VVNRTGPETGDGPELLVGGRYRIGPKIGEGGMGAVYRTVDVKTGRPVALKLLLEAGEKSLARFAREARAAASLRHPHIVALLDFDTADPNGAYLVMELVEGVSLQDLLAREGRLEPGRAVAIARQLFSALAHAHAAGILHRDVKPGNILLSATDAARDYVRLVDFGLAKSQDPGALPAVTTMPAMLGTPAYMPPEQMMGEALDARADLYAAGLVLYRMLAGADAYTVTGAERVRLVMDRHPGRPLRSLAPWVDPRLAALVDACTTPERTQRPASATQIIEALARADASAGGAPIAPATTNAAPPSQAPSAAAAPRTALIFIVAVASAFALGALGILGIVLFAGRGDKPDEPRATLDASSIAPSTAPAVVSVASVAPSAVSAPPPPPPAKANTPALPSPPTSAPPAPRASTPPPSAGSCFCKDLRGPLRLCTSVQTPSCTCGGNVCREPWTATGPERRCLSGLASFGGPGKKSGERCGGFLPGTARDGSAVTIPGEGKLVCSVCNEPSRISGVQGAPCKGFDNVGVLSDGQVECR